MKDQTKLLIFLIVLALLDMLIPIPFAAALLIYITVQKPAWFREWVDRIFPPA